MDRPHLAAEPLQRKHRGAVADMAINNMGLRERIAPVMARADIVFTSASSVNALSASRRGALHVTQAPVYLGRGIHYLCSA